MSMPIPLPAAGDTDWMDWAEQTDRVARLVDLPEAAAFDAAATSAVAPTALLGKTTRFRGTITQPLPAATPGRMLAVGVETLGLSLARDGSDVIVDDAGTSSTTFTPTTRGVRKLHCTTAGQWRTVAGHLPVSALDERYPLATATPTVEELAFSKDITSASVSSATSSAVFTAPFPLRILSASLCVWGGSSVTADDTNYWTADLRKGTGTTFATKNTRATGGQAITVRSDWNFDAVAFDSAGSTFAKGNVMAAYLTPTGTPSAIGAGANLTVRYMPL